MSVISESYLLILRKKLSELHGIELYGTVVEPGYTQLQNRIAEIFALEVVLHLHREKYSTGWANLRGKRALEHLLIHKYSWSLSEIRSMSLSDIFLSLHEELLPKNLPEEVVNLINSYSTSRRREYFSDYRLEEWDPELYLQIPPPRHW